jgi:flagellar hook assembly protein FlgD
VIFNLLGQEVRTLVAGERAAGLHRLNWDGTDDAGRAMGSGMYIYRLTGEGFVQTRRMMLLK